MHLIALKYHRFAQIAKFSSEIDPEICHIGRKYIHLRKLHVDLRNYDKDSPSD